ncbi:ribonuclease H-like domain-containing protein [Tanacetum coccineum]
MRWWRGGGFGSGRDGGEEVMNVVVRGWCRVVAVVRWCDDVGGVVSDVVREVVASDVWQQHGDEGGVPAVEGGGMEWWRLAGGGGRNIFRWWGQNSKEERGEMCVRWGLDVASESAFSTGRRVLDPYRTSLSSQLVEALLCTQDWIRRERREINVDVIEDLLNDDEVIKYIEEVNSYNSYLRDILGDILGKDMHYPFTRFVKPFRVSLVYKRNPTAYVDEASYHEDASDSGTATNKPKQQQQVTPTTTTILNIKLPILKNEEYDIWAMDMEHYLEYIDNDVWKVIQNGNSKKRISTGKDGVVRILPPVSAAEIHAVEKERKTRTILLMAIPKEYLRRFRGMDDAKEIWEAIRTRFGGNENSKKMQKDVLKQQFEAFYNSDSEVGKGNDRFQQLLSQLEAIVLQYN